MTFTFQAPVTLFHVFDVAVSIAFYRDVLGFQVAGTNESGSDDERAGWALLRMGDVTLMLSEAYAGTDRPIAPDFLRASAHADTVLYMVCMELDVLCRHLRQAGVRAEKVPAPFGGMEQIFVSDPDGYLLCCQRPNNVDATLHRTQ